MADSNHVRRDDYMQFSENDPFAELTRIMGHDPREQQPAASAQEQQAAAVPAAEDFAIDLERELAADLDFADFDEPALPDDWRVQTQAEEPVAALAQPEHGALDAEFDAFFAQTTADAAPVAVAAPQPVDLSAGISDAMAEGLDDVLERELFFDHEVEPLSEPAYQAQPAYENHAAEPDHGTYAAGLANDIHEAQLTYEDVAGLTNEYAAEPHYEHAAEPAYQAVAPQYAPEPNHGAAPEPVAIDDWTSEAEFDIDFLERELAASGAPAGVQPEDQSRHQMVVPPPASFEGESFSEEVSLGPEPATVAEAAERPLSLEEELNLLLADDPMPATPREFAPSHQPVAPASFGRANFAAPRPQAGIAPVAMPVDRPEVLVTEAQAAVAAPAFAAAASAFPAVAAPAYEPASIAPAALAEPVADDEFDHLFDDDFTLQLDDETEMQPAAYATPELPDIETPNIVTLDVEAPDIETIEVAEAVPLVNDDLDIPEITYDVPASATTDFHDDFQADFAHLFGDAGVAETVPAAVAAEPAALSDEQSPAGYASADQSWQAAAQDFGDTGFDYETDLEQAIAMSAYEEEPAQPAPRRRGILVAAALGGVVLLGGAGVAGLSMFGGDSGAPAIIRADPDPMKVRPENPGGTTVPNQDNEVYQRVSGAGTKDGPLQEQLITSVEEPLDVAARTAAPPEMPATIAPGLDEDAEAPVKSEARIEPTPEVTSPVETQETAMVTPRRVRTMVVRPDGTMVPREEPAAAVPEAQAGAQQAVAAGEAALLAPVGQPVQQQPADDANDGPVIDMPQTVAVVPTQRSAAAQPAATQQAAARQPATTPAPAATQASAPTGAAAAATASEWSMQIASQPTAESAQSSYQDLARRYGSVLEGRGVNIVRADIDGRGTYYRVRIPATSRDEAIRLCTSYKAAGGSCFVSR